MKKLQSKLLVAVVVLSAICASAKADDKPVVKEQTTFRSVVSLEPAPARAPKLVTAKVYPRYNKLVRGEKCPFALELTVKDGWHINANPSNPDYTIPTVVTVKSKQKVKLKQVKYPRHSLHTMEGEDDPYHVYDGRVMIYLLLVPDANESASKAEVEFHIRFQACNDEECIKPATVAIGGSMKLADSDDDIKLQHADKFPKPKKERAE